MRGLPGLVLDGGQIDVLGERRRPDEAAVDVRAGRRDFHVDADVDDQVGSSQGPFGEFGHGRGTRGRSREPPFSAQAEIVAISDSESERASLERDAEAVDGLPRGHRVVGHHGCQVVPARFLACS